MALYFTNFPLPLIGWLYVILFLQPLTWVVPFFFRLSRGCSPERHVSSITFHCCSIGCICRVTGVPYLLPGVALCLFMYTTELSGVALHHPRCLTAAHWVVFMSSLVSQCYLLGLLCFVTRVQLLLTGVAQGLVRCLTVIYWDDFVSCQVSQYCSLWWFSNFAVSLCHSLRWLCVI